MKNLSEIKTHWLWQEKTYSKLQAWIDLVIMSEEESTFYRGKIYTLAQDQLIISEPELSNRWGWSRTKVRNFLQLLQDDSLIELEPDHRKTKITILDNPLKQIIIQEPKQEEVHEKKQDEKHMTPAPDKNVAKSGEQEKRQETKQQKNSTEDNGKTNKAPQIKQKTIFDEIEENSKQ